MPTAVGAGYAPARRGPLPRRAACARSSPSGMRPIRHRYRDPLEEVWLATALRLGLRVERSEAVYATYDGQGTLTLTDARGFDADDSLAQLIFHELCHALVAGPRGIAKADWGLENTDARDIVQEHACHRVQAALADRYGLRDFFAVTTEHRSYWDALPGDPLTLHPAAAPDDGQAVALAREALERATHGPWSEPLAQALERTAQIAQAVCGLVPPESLWRTVRARHPSGFPEHGDPGKTCGTCAWCHAGGPGPRRHRCRQTRRGGRGALRIDPGARACERWEPALSEAACGTCGACCRGGFDLVPVGAREPVRKRHASLVHQDAHGYHIPRPGGRCLALAGDGAEAGAFRCRVYTERPNACRSFAIGGDACLEARRRVGLSRR
jgi:hypothetical protein